MESVLSREEVYKMDRASIIKRLCSIHGRMEFQMIKFTTEWLADYLADLEEVPTITVADIDLTPELDTPREAHRGRQAVDLTSAKRALADQIVNDMKTGTTPVRKSDVIKRLDEEGFKYAEIALYLECKYQMVYNVLKYNPEKKLK